jgi:transcription factor SFP1
MAAGPGSPSEPIAIATSRQNSHSPRNQQSNLSSQFQQPRIDVPATHGMEPPSRHESEHKGRQESVGMLGTTPYGAGARSIPVHGSMRRESTALAGSLMGGMSWGGISMGSYIRDE